VFYSDDPNNVAYDDIGHSLRDVYGTDALNTGVVAEVNYGLYLVNGTGNQSINMTFLYDDGSYQFQFGYYEVTTALQALPYSSVAEKQAWARQALSTAVVVFVDRTSGSAPSGATIVSTDANDVYTAAVNDPNRNHDTGVGDTYAADSNATVTLQGGRYYSFFIIPNNTLVNFLGDFTDNGVYNTFALDGNGTGAWPLFAQSEGNPGNGTGGSGDGLDQAFTFFGTTRSTTANALAATGNPNFAPDPGSPGSLITFEDIRRIGGAGDNDFNDIHFYIDNTNLTGIVVPEPETWVWTVLLLALVVFHVWRRKKLKTQTN